MKKSKSEVLLRSLLLWLVVAFLIFAMANAPMFGKVAILIVTGVHAYFGIKDLTK